MIRVPLPEFEDAQGNYDEDKAEEFWSNISSADWKESPESVLNSIDKLIKQHGLTVRIYNADADSVFFDIVEISNAR